MRIHRIIAVASTALTMALTTLAAPCALANEHTSHTRPDYFAEEPTNAPIQLTIDDISPRVLTTEDTLTIRVSITNTTILDIHTPTLTIALQSTPAENITELSEYFAGNRWDGTQIYDAPLPITIASGETQTFTTTIPRDELPLNDETDWGARGLTAQLTTSDTTIRDRSVFLWDSGTPITPAHTSITVPTPLPLPPNTTDTLQRLSTLPGITLAVTPENMLTPNETADQPQSDTNTTQHHNILRTSTNEILALLPFNADPGQVAASNNPELIVATTQHLHHFPNRHAPEKTQPHNTTHTQPQSGDATQSTTDTPQSTPPNENHTPPLTAPLLTNVLWPTHNTFSRELLRTFPDNAIIAPPNTLTPTEELNFTPTPIVAINHADGTTALPPYTDTTSTILVPHNPTSALLSWDAAQPSERLDRDQLLAAIGAIFVRENPTEQRAFFATFPRQSHISPDTLRRAEALLKHRWINAIPLSTLLTYETTDIPRTPVPEFDKESPTYTPAKDANHYLQTTAVLRTTLTNPEEFNNQQLDTVFNALAHPTNTHTLRTQANKLRTSIHAKPSATVNLINKTANFPVRVSNTLPWPTTVTVTLEPSDPRLSIGNTATVEIPPTSTQTVEIPVTAIGAGDIDVTYIVRSPDGTLLDNSQTVRVRLRAGWEDALTATFGLIITVLFVSGLSRTLRRRLQTHDTPGTGGDILHGMIPVSDYLNRKENQ